MDAGGACVTTLHYRQDQVGYLDDGYTHLFVVPADGGTARQLTTGKWSVGAGELRGGGAFDWTPDSKSIVFDGNRSPTPTCRYETSHLYVVDVATGAIRDLVTKPGEWGKPVVSPDGQRRVHRLRAHPHAHGQRHVGRRHGRERHAQDQRRLRSRSDQPALGAGRQRRLFRRRRPWLAQRLLRAGGRRGREAGDQRPHVLTFDSVSRTGLPPAP